MFVIILVSSVAVFCGFLETCVFRDVTGVVNAVLKLGKCYTSVACSEYCIILDVKCFGENIQSEDHVDFQVLYFSCLLLAQIGA